MSRFSPQVAELKALAEAAAGWRQRGEPDPHKGSGYDGGRDDLALGHYTDDELANAVFMYGDKPLNVDAVMRGEPSGHTFLVAAKERIRWLSRKLVASVSLLVQMEAELERLGKAAQWQGIESAPKDGTFYLAWDGRETAVVNEPPGCARGTWHTSTLGNFWHGGAINNWERFTHWMPLPPQPSTGETK